MPARRYSRREPNTGWRGALKTSRLSGRRHGHIATPKPATKVARDQGMSTHREPARNRLAWLHHVFSGDIHAGQNFRQVSGAEEGSGNVAHTIQFDLDQAFAIPGIGVALGVRLLAA